MNISVNKNWFSPVGNGLKKINKETVDSPEIKQCDNLAPSALRSYISFKGNAPKITKATFVTTKSEDTEIPRTANGGYIVEPKTQTELIYGIDATKFLNKTNKFEYDTQITFPKKAKGTLIIDGKEVKIKENSTVLLNKGTEAKVKIDAGYPQILMTKKDYSWYTKHSNRLDQEPDLRNKFYELTYRNSHTFNGEFKSNMFSQDENKNNEIIARLKDTGFVSDVRGDYLRFNSYPNWNYQSKELAKKGFSKEDLELIKPVYEQIRQTKMDTKLALKNYTNGMSPETVQKLKNCGILFNNRKNKDEVYWITNFEGEYHLREALNYNGIYDEEQNSVVNAWTQDNKIGFDLSGLKFINDNVAVYCLDDKINNWNMEKSCWLTNSTAMSSKKGAPSIGTSIVQANKQEPTPMSNLRKGEHLHTHPGDENRSQTEIYMVTSGSAALTVVRDGVPQVKILKEGELAVIPPKTPHCVNSVMGEYEQVVSQIPSAFQYGLAFKEGMELPEGYTEEQMVELARKELKAAQNK